VIRLDRPASAEIANLPEPTHRPDQVVMEPYVAGTTFPDPPSHKRNVCAEPICRSFPQPRSLAP
jgi:hypothetical protein